MAAPNDLGRVDAYRYELPEDRIAKQPAAERDASRLLVLDGDKIAHRTFRDFPGLLRAGDLLVVNETRVIRARLRGTRVPGGGAAEVLLLRPSAAGPFDPKARRWSALVRPGRRLGVGGRIRFADAGEARVVDVARDGVRELELQLNVEFDELLERFGELPLPPYVGPGDDVRAARYQTVFARVEGSVAAPTASLHFTPATFDAIRERGVTIAPLVLDVGLGTFRAMEGERLEDHPMHAERYAIPEETAEAVRAARGEGRRVVAAGTTVLRALEAAAASARGIVAGEAETELFVRPGFRFEVVDALLTNFHLPASTLLVLVTTFGGYDRVMNAYQIAIAQDYRFYSFGDAMFIARG
ncbi:MAG: tRNA preQ1(34) S-adenosylmethionine ribosyltransferase-isomerase QueA [Candidatus Baltobacteraceae bacterium]